MKKIIVLFLITFFAVSCKNKRVIGKNDLIVKCVITDCTKSFSHSTLDPTPNYIYETDCGTKIVTNRYAYEIGDTVTYVYVDGLNKK